MSSIERTTSGGTRAWKLARLAQTIAQGIQAALSAPNFVQAQGNTGSGTTTSSVTTTAIAKKKSGDVSVKGIATGQISANGTVSVSLLRDNVSIQALPALTVLADTAFSIPIQVIDTLTDTANHTYTVQAVADGAHTITTGANGNEIQAVEM